MWSTNRKDLQFVDYHLRPLVENLPSFIKDTTSFITKLQSLKNIPEGTLLVTLDVSSLYTNIPHQEGIEVCTEALNTRIIQQSPTEDLAELINQILTKNNFEFGDQHFLQVHGTGMGTRMAPSYAFNKRTTDLKEHLTRCGYDETTVQQQIERAKHLHQEDTLRPPTEKATNKRTPLVVSYHPNLPHLTALTKEKLPILHASNCLKQAIPKLPIVAYRRPKNLRDLLVSAELKTPDSCQAQGSSPCGHPRC